MKTLSKQKIGSLMAFNIRLEELAITVASILLLAKFNLGISFWVWLILFFAPDISMLGYVVNKSTGVFTYNLFHHRAVALIIIAIGLYTGMQAYTATGLLLLAHASFDRMMGYGLKYKAGFKHTHLGAIGKG